MFAFPLFNFVFLIILYHIHKRAFYVTTAIELIVHGIGFWIIYGQFHRADNQFLYTLALTAIGFIIALFAFFVAIFLNNKKYHNS